MSAVVAAGGGGVVVGCWYPSASVIRRSKFVRLPKLPTNSLNGSFPVKASLRKSLSSDVMPQLARTVAPPSSEKYAGVLVVKLPSNRWIPGLVKRHRSSSEAYVKPLKT